MILVGILALALLACVGAIAHPYKPFVKRWQAIAATSGPTVALAAVLFVQGGAGPTSSAADRPVGVSPSLVSGAAGTDPMKTSAAGRPKGLQTAARPMSGAPCGPGEVATGRPHRVIASVLNVRVGPGAEFDRLVAETGQRGANDAYVRLPRATTVLETCRKGGWSQIEVTKPLAITGWVANRFLAAQ